MRILRAAAYRAYPATQKSVSTSGSDSALSERFCLRSDRGAVAVAGVDDRVIGQQEQLRPDRVLERREVRVRASCCAWSAVEQGVAGEHAAELRSEEHTSELQSR